MLHIYSQTPALEHALEQTHGTVEVVPAHLESALMPDISQDRQPRALSSRTWRAEGVVLSGAHYPRASTDEVSAFRKDEQEKKIADVSNPHRFRVQHL